MAKVRKCLSCGKEYEYCPRCDADNQTPWMITFDCPACRDIFNVVSGYNMGISTLADVKEVLNKYQIVDVSVYAGAVKEVLMLAMNEPKKNVDIELKTKDGEKKPMSKGISK